MSGTFGYELDLGKLKRAECTAVKNQIKRFKRLNDLIRTGDYYRLTDPAENTYFTAWQFAAEDGSEALLNLVVTHPQANPLPITCASVGWKKMLCMNWTASTISALSMPTT